MQLPNPKRWNTPLESASAMFEYVEVFQNRQLRPSSIGMLTPIQYEKIHRTKTAGPTPASRGRETGCTSFQTHRHHLSDLNDTAGASEVDVPRSRRLQAMAERSKIRYHIQARAICSTVTITNPKISESIVGPGTL